MKIRKDLVKYKAHNVALYWKLDTRAFVQHCLNLSALHRLESLEDIDAWGKEWYKRKKQLEQPDDEKAYKECEK